MVHYIKLDILAEDLLAEGTFLCTWYMGISVYHAHLLDHLLPHNSR